MPFPLAITAVQANGEITGTAGAGESAAWQIMAGGLAGAPDCLIQVGQGAVRLLTWVWPGGSDAVSGIPASGLLRLVFTPAGNVQFWYAGTMYDERAYATDAGTNAYWGLSYQGAAGTIEAHLLDWQVEADGVTWSTPWDDAADLASFVQTGGVATVTGGKLTLPSRPLAVTGRFSYFPLSYDRKLSKPGVPIWTAQDNGGGFDLSGGYWPAFPATAGVAFPNIVLDDIGGANLVYERRYQNAICSRLAGAAGWGAELTISLSGHFPSAARLEPSQHVVVCYTDGSTSMLSKVLKWTAGATYDLGTEKTVGLDSANQRATLVMLPNGTMQCYYRLATGAATGLKTTADGETWG